jgi:hypothetical protein
VSTKRRVELREQKKNITFKSYIQAENIKKIERNKMAIKKNRD